MSKWNIKNANFAMSIAGNSLTCVQQIDINETAPTTEVECAGATSVEYVTGLPRLTMTYSGALETDDITLVNNIRANDTGALILTPAGTTAGDFNITSTNVIITDFSMAMPVNGFASYSGSAVLDDITVAAIGA